MASSPSPLASTPPMGWNSWNMFGQDISEASIRETADALVSSGLKDHGYNYIVIDDCWSKKDGREGNGDLITDRNKFPNGIKALADTVHYLGFKIGIIPTRLRHFHRTHTCPRRGLQPCRGVQVLPCSLGLGTLRTRPAVTCNTCTWRKCRCDITIPLT